MTVSFQNARSVLRVSHGTVPGPSFGGPFTAPARRLWPTRSMLPVWGRCGSRGGSCAPLGAADTRVAAMATETDSANRLPVRIEGPPPLRNVASNAGRAVSPSDTSSSNGAPIELYRAGSYGTTTNGSRRFARVLHELEQLGSDAAAAAAGERPARPVWARA